MESQELVGLQEVSQTLSLEFAKSDFADLIINFLGAKEKLTYHCNLPFLIKLNDMQQFDFVLKEKISREKGVILDSFIATIHYSDSTSRTVITLNSLERYLETRDVAAAGVTLEWHIITKLESSKSTETQKITVTFNAVDHLYKGDVSLSIEHTNQAWGNEVLNLFRDRILDTTVPVPRIAKLSGMILEKMTFSNYVGLIAMLGVLLIVSWLAIRKPEVPNPSLEAYSLNELVHGYYKSGEGPEYQKGITLIRNLHFTQLEAAAIDIIDSDEVEKILKSYSLRKHEELKRKGSISIEEFVDILLWVFLAPFLILFLAPRIYLKSIVKYHGVKSFVIVNNRSEKEYERYMHEKSKVKYYTFSAFFYAVMTSAIGSYIYAIFF